jgi:hypothetical protein
MRLFEEPVISDSSSNKRKNMTRKQRLHLRRAGKTMIALMPFIMGLAIVLLVAFFGTVCTGQFEGDPSATCVKIIK